MTLLQNLSFFNNDTENKERKQTKRKLRTITNSDDVRI